MDRLLRVQRPAGNTLTRVRQLRQAQVTETLPTILLTRPKAQSEAFAEVLRRRIDRDIPILVSPILEIRTVPLSDEGGRPAFLVLTSVHAVPAIAGDERLRGLRAYCVGDATSDAARLAGADAVSAGGTARELMDQIRLERPVGTGLYLRGRHVSTDLVDGLREVGIELKSSIVYDQLSRPLSGPARALLERSGEVVLPIFSARSARLLAGEAGASNARVRVVAMSDTVAGEWPREADIAGIARVPNAEAMAEAVAACLTG